MQVRVRHTPSVLGLLAVGCAAGSVMALFIEAGSGIVDTFTWSAPLWFSAGLAAVAALLLGLVFDRRGPRFHSPCSPCWLCCSPRLS